MGRFLVLIAVVLGLGFGVAYAGTTTISGSASNGKPLIYAFTTSAEGPVTVNATWTPKGTSQVRLLVKHLTNPADPMSYDLACLVYVNAAGNIVEDGDIGTGVPGNFTCSYESGPAGYWTAEFRPFSGSIKGAQLTITTN